MKNFKILEVGQVMILRKDKPCTGSNNGLSPDQRQAIIWTITGLLSIEFLETYFSEICIKIQPFSFIEENQFENFVSETVAISLRPQCVNSPSAVRFMKISLAIFKIWILMMLQNHWPPDELERNLTFQSALCIPVAKHSLHEKLSWPLVQSD